MNEAVSKLIATVKGEEPPTHSKPSAIRRRVGVKLMTQVLQSLDELGGVDYLVKIGRQHPKTYATLLGKVLPQQVDINDNTGLAALLEQRLNNAKEIHARELQRVAAHAAEQERRTINGEARQVNTP